MEKEKFDKQDVLTCFEFAIAELDKANEEMTKEELYEVLIAAENLLDEAKEEFEEEL